MRAMSALQKRIPIEANTMLLYCQAITRFAAITLLSFTMMTGEASAQNNQTECADMGLAVTGEQAFTSFCGRCHRAEKVATCPPDGGVFGRYLKDPPGVWSNAPVLVTGVRLDPCEMPRAAPGRGLWSVRSWRLP